MERLRCLNEKHVSDTSHSIFRSLPFRNDQPMRGSMPKKGYQNETVSSATPHLPELVAGAKPLRSHGNLRRGRGHHQPDLLEAPVPDRDPFEFIPGPKLRGRLGVSAVTLWRWRHDKEKGFPIPKVINGRLYFAVGAVVAWLARQADS